MTMTTTARRTLRPRRLLAVASVAALVVVPGAPSAFAGPNPGENVEICHATSAETNPYVVNSPNKNGDVSGHADHTGPIWAPGMKDDKVEWGDIIPPFDYVDENGRTQHFAGLNYSDYGAAWLANDCRVPISATVDKVNDANGDATFTDDETATAEDADVAFRVTVTNTSVVDAVITGVVDKVGTESVAFTPAPDPVGTVLAPSASTSFTFTMTGYSPPDGQSVVNVVTVTLAKADDSENTASAFDDSTVRTVVPPPPAPDVAVVKVGTATAAPGDTLTWTLRASNTGTIPASGVTLTDQLPAAVTFVSATGDGWSCTNPTASTVVCTYGSDLAAGASAPDVTLVGTLDAAFTGTSVTNTVVVTPDDVTPADNSSSFTTVVTQGGGGGGGGGTVNPPPDFTGGGGGTTLPRTGSPLLWLVASGLALVLAGSGTVLLLSPVRRDS